MIKNPSNNSKRTHLFLSLPLYPLLSLEREHSYDRTVLSLPFFHDKNGIATQRLKIIASTSLEMIKTYYCRDLPYPFHLSSE